MLYSLVPALWGEGKTGPTPSETRGNLKSRVCGLFFDSSIEVLLFCSQHTGTLGYMGVVG